MDQVLTAEVVQSRRARRDSLELLAELASEVAPGSDGLLFLSPSIYADAGGFVGLSYQHRRGHLVRAVLESGALAVSQQMAALVELKRRPEHLTVTGPGAANHLWCQILADALAMPVHAIPCVECNTVGAAMLAISSIGIFKTIDEACTKMVRAKTTYHPRKAATDIYAALAPTLTRWAGRNGSAVAAAVAKAEPAQ